MTWQDQEALDLQKERLLRDAENKRFWEPAQSISTLSLMISVHLVEQGRPSTIKESFLAHNMEDAMRSFCYAFAIDPRDIVSMTITKAAS